jgi:hypothetical protein
MQLSTPRIKSTNPATKVTYEIRNDRKPPFFDAQISKSIYYSDFINRETQLIASISEDNRRIIFETSGLHISDVLMTFNRLLGSESIGKAGVWPKNKV